jgi:hypothetical protein
LRESGQALEVRDHGNSGFDVEITGVVTEWKWANPHTWITLSGVDDGKGGRTDWSAEGRPPGVLGRAGWSKAGQPNDELREFACAEGLDHAK